MAFAENLAHLMEINEITNYYLAKRLGVSQTSVANWVNGSNQPHKKTRIAIAEVFGLSLEEIEGDKMVDGRLDKKETLTDCGGGLDPTTKELFELVESASDSERKMMLEMLRVLKRGGK